MSRSPTEIKKQCEDILAFYKRPQRPVKVIEYWHCINGMHHPCGTPHELGKGLRGCWNDWQEAIDAELAFSRSNIPLLAENNLSLLEENKLLREQLANLLGEVIE